MNSVFVLHCFKKHNLITACRSFTWICSEWHKHHSIHSKHFYCISLAWYILHNHNAFAQKLPINVLLFPHINFIPLVLRFYSKLETLCIVGTTQRPCSGISLIPSVSLNSILDMHVRIRMIGDWWQISIFNVDFCAVLINNVWVH